MTNYHDGVVILNYNTEADTIACVESIVKHSTDCGIPLLYIVDNASCDGSGMNLYNRYSDDDGIKVILLDKNGGFSYGNNIGIQKAKEDGCKNVFILNSDIVLLNDAIAIMADELDNRNDIAVVGPRIFDKEGKDIQFARKALTWHHHIMERLPGISEKQVRRYKYNKDQDYCFEGMVSGCCFGIKLEYFNAENVLDDNIFMYYEEDVLAHKMLEKGKRVLISSKAKVLHNEASSTKRSVSDKEVFERFHRWTSASYVLSHYSRASKLQIILIKLLNRFEWRVLSLYKSEYRKRNKEFAEKNN